MISFLLENAAYALMATYAMFAFGKMVLNPAQWPDETRFVACMVFVFLTFILCMTMAMSEQNAAHEARMASYREGV